MPGIITHDLQAKSEIVFEHSTEPGYLAIVETDTYPAFVREDATYPDTIAHIEEQMAKGRIAAWGCPDVTARIRIRLTHEYTDNGQLEPYAAGFRTWIKSPRGRLCFASDRDLGFCAAYPHSSLLDERDDPDVYRTHVLNVPAGDYCIVVYRHFGWFEGDQDAPQRTKDDIDYTVLLWNFDFPANAVRHHKHMPWLRRP